MLLGLAGCEEDRGSVAASPSTAPSSGLVEAARLQYREGAHLAALEAADLALARNPDDPAALLLRAQLVRDAHGYFAALPWFEAATRAAPTDPDAWVDYAATLGDAGQTTAMLAAVRRLAESAPDEPRVFFLQAVLAARADDPALARSLLARSGLAARGVPAATLLDAIIALEEDNPDSAAAILEGLAERQPANARVRELLARALLLGGRAGEVVERFGAEAQRGDASPYLELLVARAHERLGDRERAAPLLARAYAGAGEQPVVLGVRPGLPEPTTVLRLAVGKANAVDALARAGALRQRFPQSADIAILSGDASLAAGHPREALGSYALAMRVKRPWPLTRKAAFAYRASGDDVAADILLLRHVAGEPDGLTGLFALARRRALQGDWERTARLLDHAIVLGGGHDPALLSLRIDAARALGWSSEAQEYAVLLANVRPPALTR